MLERRGGHVVNFAIKFKLNEFRVVFIALKKGNVRYELLKLEILQIIML